MIIENLRAAGVQQAHMEDRYRFHVADRAAGLLTFGRGAVPSEGTAEKRAGIFIVPSSAWYRARI